jgi:hypothetical protein
VDVSKNVEPGADAPELGEEGGASEMVEVEVAELGSYCEFGERGKTRKKFGET